MSSARRLAELVVVLEESDSNLLADFTKGVFSPDEDRFNRFFKVRSTDELDGRAAEVHLDDLKTNAQALVDAIFTLNIVPTICVLRVIQYIGIDDEVGPGISIDEAWVAVLARLGGCVDLDIYVV